MRSIGRPHHLIVDCADPLRLAQFYSALFGLPITFESDEFVVVARDETTSGYAFAKVDRPRRPTWPDPEVPQQAHLDVMVDDLAQAAAEVIALGATVLDAASHVFADPAGHPFCLIARPGWAEPVGERPVC